MVLWITTNIQRTVCEYQPVRVAEAVEVAAVLVSANPVVVAGYFPIQLIGEIFTAIGVQFCHVPERIVIAKCRVVN